MAVKSGLVRQLFKWLGIGLAVVLVGIPLVFALVFLGIQEATERQWLGKAPESEAIAARSKAPHRVALLDVGFDSLAERLRLIEAAQKSIELEFFIYQIDTSSRLLTQALARKAQQGVQVRMLVDFAMPVFKLAPQYVKTLEAAGVQVVAVGDVRQSIYRLRGARPELFTPRSDSAQAAGTEVRLTRTFETRPAAPAGPDDS